jgi:hypothetical protein
MLELKDNLIAMNEHDEKLQESEPSIDYVSSRLTLAAILKQTIYDRKSMLNMLNLLRAID